MARAERILVTCLSAALLALAFLGRNPVPVAVEAGAPATERAASSGDYDEDYGAFAALLGSFLDGEEDALDELRSAAERLRRDHGRSDAPVVVEYYAALPPAARAHGQEEYALFRGLWSRVGRATAESWSAERPLVLAELRALIARAGDDADFVPAARALSLCARIEVGELESDAGMDERARAEILARARLDAREALALLERAGQRTPRLEPLWLLGRSELLAGDAAAAAGRFEECRRAAIEARSDVFHEHAILGLIRVARAAGDVARIDALLAELAGFRSPRECWPLVREHALRLVHEDSAEQALELLGRRQPEAEADRREWSHLLGLARMRRGDMAGARAAFEQAAWEPDGEDASLALATLDLAEGRARHVLAALGSQALSGLSFQGRTFARSLVGEALLAEGRPGEALGWLREALNAAGRWEARLEEQRILAGTTSSVMGERMGLHTVALAARALVELGRPLEAAAVIEGFQSRGLRERAELTSADVLAWAAAYEHGLATWVAGADSAVCVWVAPDGVAAGRMVPRSRRAIARATRRLREAALAGDEAAVGAHGAELAHELLPDELHRRLAVAGELAGDGGEPGRILLLAHGPLERLPFELLAIDGLALDRRAAVLVLPGLPAGAPAEPDARATAARWELLGDPLDARGRPLLSAAHDELATLRALRPEAALHAGADFTRAALSAALTSGAAVHVATHLCRDCGGCDDGRLASIGLVLSGSEILCARDVVELRPSSPLVVLAACSTADGRFVDAEGLLGLARALLESGTRNLLVTQWPVEDASARAFTPAFHRALAAGAPPSQAARRARAELRAAGAAAADWAAFRLVGRD